MRVAEYWPEEPFDDSIFDPDEVEAGAWVPGPYGPGDELGTFNEVTPEKTARTLAMLDTSAPVRSYNLAEVLFNGFPAYGSRAFEQKLHVVGYRPPPGFQGICDGTDTIGPCRTSVHEERVSFTFNMGSKVNGLHHTGVGEMFYNGFKGPEIARSWGSTHLGSEKLPPIVTRGVLIDALALVLERGQRGDVFRAGNGNPVLRSNYRITIEEIESCLARQEVRDPIGPGDVVLFRTGWSNLIREDPKRYLEGGPPGPSLAELKYLAARRPALLGSDTWCFEVMDPAIVGAAGTPGHQLLSMRYGIRIGEAIRLQELADDRVWEFVFCHTPLRCEGAVAGGAPCLALGQPRDAR